MPTRFGETTIPFGPQLIGQTEKALNAVLRTIIATHELTEAQWVTLRLTSQFDGTGSFEDHLADRTQFPDPSSLVSELALRGLLTGQRLTEAGDDLVAVIGNRIAQVTGPIWDSLDAEDVATTGRVLNAVLERTREVLRSSR
ncbi:hypothetical protein [Occultella aeris]|uniref:hypothetical protein n=1 Tax=Occultella aeris TaxID=2761496 RepID=UPI003B42B0E7